MIKIIALILILSGQQLLAQHYPPLKLKESPPSFPESVTMNGSVRTQPLKLKSNVSMLKDTIESYYGAEPEWKKNKIELDSTYKAKKNFWLPAIEVLGLSYVIWAADHYIAKAPWANISIQSVKDNFHKMWVWDHDFFVTNQWSHPYHGSLNFNFARSSGLGFWESAPYTLGGSLVWELFLETNTPSKNDLISTTLGGIALGEMLYRLSSLVIDERRTGFPRVISEIEAFLLAPTRFFNRFIKGDISRVRSKSIYEIEPVKSSVSAGPSYVWTKEGIYKGSGNLSLKVDLYYGSPHENKKRKPYDFFNMKALFGIGAQPFINQVSAYGLLFGSNITHKSNQDMLVGAFQHFDFFNNKNFKIAAQSFGGGIIYRLPNVGKTRIETSMHFGGIVLGGGNNPPEFWVYEADSTAYRDYNFGMGFTTKFETILAAKFGYLFLGFNLFRIFNVSGASGNDQLLVIYPRLVVQATKKFNFGLEYDVYFRDSDYKTYPDVHFRSNELKFLLSTMF